MFFFSLQPLMSLNWILIAAAVVPAFILMRKVWQLDRIEKESPKILLRLVIGGVLSTMLALAEEWAGEWILGIFLPEGSRLYNILLYFAVVGLAEESSKFLFLKKRTWNSGEFNCQYDGVVYAVFVSLGFALWENIGYVLRYGFGTALARAVTAIPGHACFGVFMGIFYGAAKRLENYGNESASRTCRKLAVILPMLIHGTYDYIASMQSTGSTLLFLAFIVILFIISFKTVKKASAADRYID